MIDLGFQLAYRSAHRLLRLYWSFRHPLKGGTLIAMWHAGRILIVKNTYRKEHTLPGGYPRRGETPGQTGARELAEECGIVVRPEQLRQVYRGEYLFEGRRDDVTILEVELNVAPTIEIDFREISSARMMSAQEALALHIVPHVRDYLEGRQMTDLPQAD